MRRGSSPVILKELDACQAYFQVLHTILDNNAIVRDYHALAALASSGSERIDKLVDRLDELLPIAPLTPKEGGFP